MDDPFRPTAWFLRAMIAVTLLAPFTLVACGTRSQEQSMAEAAALTGGNPHLGPAKIRQYGCNACHTIPGVRGANREVGPPLSGIAERMYIAGVLTNTPENLVRWIQDPPGIDSLTAMPNLGVSAADARDIAAYLYAQQ